MSRLSPSDRVTLFEKIDNTQRLRIVLEPAIVAHAFVERILTTVAERRVPEVMREGDALDEILVKCEIARD